jgi:ferrous iron transport protein A
VPTDLLLPLDLLRTGDWADVEEVRGDASWVSRMAEFGLRIGTRLQVLRQGSPCLLGIGALRLSLRGESGAQIMVRPVPAGN